MPHNSAQQLYFRMGKSGVQQEQVVVRPLAAPNFRSIRRHWHWVPSRSYCYQRDFPQHRIRGGMAPSGGDSEGHWSILSTSGQAHALWTCTDMCIEHGGVRIVRNKSLHNPRQPGDKQGNPNAEAQRRCVTNRCRAWANFASEDAPTKRLVI